MAGKVNFLVRVSKGGTRAEMVGAASSDGNFREYAARRVKG